MPTRQFPETYVFSQTPRPGDRIQKNNFVTIYVSTGPPKTAVPSVVGEQVARALSDLQDAKLKGRQVTVDSDKPQGQVISQSPKAGASVAEGTSIKLNVSKGPTPVAVPNVVGSTYDTASSILQAKGFAVRRTDVKSDQPKDTVIGMTPTAGTLQPPGAIINSDGFQGADDVHGSGRDHALPERRPGPAEGFGLRRAHRHPAGHRPEPGRDRPDPGSTRRNPGGAGQGRDDRRRQVRRAHDPRPSVMPRTRVAILAGGRSSEHDISLASARSVLESLDPERYDVVTVAIGRDGRWELGAGEDGSIAETLPVPAANAPATLGAVDVVLPILHGPFGEDGTVQGLLELAGVPYVGAGVAASALCMDKDLFKKVLRDSGLPVARHVALREGDPVQNPFGFPCFVKPARLGSSVGITKAHDEGELAEAVLLAFRHDDKVLVEEFLDGIEVEVGVLGNREPIASIPGQIVPLGHEWYDYSSKYDEGGMDLVIPPDLPDSVVEQVQRVAVESFRVTECEGMARVDCFVVDGDQVVVNELNTIPGFTSTSVYAKLFDASGIPYDELLRRLIELALERHERRAKLEF